MATATINQAEQGTLGAEVLSCRRNRRSSVHVGLMGIMGYVQLVLLPPIAALFCTVIVTLFVDKVLHWEGKNIHLGAAIIGLFVTITVALYIFFFSVPDEPCLVLHKNGFRYRRRTVLFSQLTAICLGQDDSTLGQLAQGLGALMSWHPVGGAAENSKQASVKLIFSDRTSTTMKNVLLENHRDDLNQFFQIIQQEQPHIRIASPGAL